MRLISSLALLACVSAISFGQTDPLGTNRPTTFTIASLPNDLIAVDVMTSKDNLMSLMQLSMGGSTITSPESGKPSLDPQLLMQMMNVIWTTKEDFNSTGEFMIGYKLDLPFMPRSSSSISPSALRFRLTYFRRQAIIALTPRDDFSPSVLKDLAKEPTPVQASAADRTTTLSNIKQAALGLILLTSDYDDFYPYVQSSPQLFEFEMPYTKNREIFKTKNPMGGEFRFNMSLAGVSATAIEAPAETPMIFESEAWPDGKRCVAFADGHAKLVAESDWLKMQPMLKLKLTRSGKPIPVGGTIPDTQAPKPVKKRKGGGR